MIMIMIMNLWVYHIDEAQPNPPNNWPTQPNPMPGELMDPIPNPTHIQPNPNAPYIEQRKAWNKNDAPNCNMNLTVNTRHKLTYTTCIFAGLPFQTHDPIQSTENKNFGHITNPTQPVGKPNPRTTLVYIPSTGQAWCQCQYHGQTVTSENFWTFKI